MLGKKEREDCNGPPKKCVLFPFPTFPLTVPFLGLGCEAWKYWLLRQQFPYNHICSLYFAETAFPSLRNLHNQKCCVLFLPLLTIQNTRMSSLTHYFPVDDMGLSITLPPQRPKRSPCDISQVLCNLGILKLER